MLGKPGVGQARRGFRRLLRGLLWRSTVNRPASAPSVKGPALRFCDFELELESGHLTQGGKPVRIQPQPARVLQYLAERAGGLVTREELHVHLWGEDHHVNFDQGLNFCIQQVRQALHDSARDPIFIETIPRRGYRFLVPVERREAEADPLTEPWRARVKASAWIVLVGGALVGFVALGVWPGTARPSTRLAVLPFSVGELPQEQRLAELVVDEIAGRLVPALTGRIGVVPTLSEEGDGDDEGRREASEASGRAPRSDFLLEGDVVRDGDRLRLLVRLVRPIDGVHVWAGIYEISMGAGDWPRHLDRVASEIAAGLTDAQRAERSGGGLFRVAVAALDGLAERVLMR